MKVDAMGPGGTTPIWSILEFVLGTLMHAQVGEQLIESQLLSNT